MATQIFLSSIYLLLLAVTLICLVSAMPLGNWFAIVLSLLAAASMIFNLFLTVRTFKSMEKKNESRLRKIEEDIVALQKVAALAHMRLDAALVEDDEDNEECIGLN